MQAASLKAWEIAHINEVGIDNSVDFWNKFEGLTDGAIEVTFYDSVSGVTLTVKTQPGLNWAAKKFFPEVGPQGKVTIKGWAERKP